ncbi:putative tyrosyl-tRNA synthetase [Mycosarcoma maydis]|uniref:Tyrosine--tRNA ligase n=1 Tax=Mycosarcoma maydis TaxID=5270 RepID=A0A0D1C9L5_MYCMD|nr:putative tyrosyl-tRNA synthetase [Ustilago maydis 521]KIS70037.1 putative tyrosyl-tRNA synthetase [Ustilago maydis 521]|eukprot:XP_011388180.1 putative tyrosyl-tRNA synthetase [Ustilago maydis 521]
MIRTALARRLSICTRGSIRLTCSGRIAQTFSASACIRHSSTSTACPPSSAACWSKDSSIPDLISELESRNLIAHVTSRSLRSHLSSAPRIVYSGVDPSADSLHVGNLLPLLTLAHFARHRHHPIVLVGGATGSIGDPSGRSTERNALSKDVLHRNVAAITQQVGKFFNHVQEYYAESTGERFAVDNHTEDKEREASRLGMGIRMMNNYEWMKDVSLLDFLGGVGRHARLTQMLARDSVASRLAPATSTGSSSAANGGGGMSYTEFSYQLLQAYDFSFLHTHHACTIQIGGSDQLGNITAGIDLIRRTSSTSLLTDPAYGLTLPLLTTCTGEKFGKSAGNAVWLSRSKTSDWALYQFFVRSSDADVERYLLSLTLLEPQFVKSIMQEHQENKKLRKAQTVLADHMTRLIRGTHAMQRCKLLTELLFSHTRTLGDPLESTRKMLSQLDTSSIGDQDGIVAKLHDEQVVGVDVTKVVTTAGLVKSRAEAKRLLISGGLYINNRQVQQDANTVVSEQDLVRAKSAGGRICLLRAGKSAVKVVFVRQT